MSQHRFHTDEATVVVGYDRTLDYVFLSVFDPKGDVLYSNLLDENAGTNQQDVEYYRGVLARLNIIVPESMFEEVKRDQIARAGNRIVYHFLDRPPESGTAGSA